MGILRLKRLKIKGKGTREYDGVRSAFLVRSQTLYPAELRARCGVTTCGDLDYSESLGT